MLKFITIYFIFTTGRVESGSSTSAFSSRFSSPSYNLAFDTSSGMFLPLLTKTLNIRCHFITSEPNFMTFYPDKILIYLTAEKNNEQFVIVALFFDEYKLK